MQFGNLGRLLKYFGLSVCITSANAKIIYIDCDTIPPPLPQTSSHSTSHPHYYHHYNNGHHSHNRYIYICRLKRTCNHHDTYGSFIGFQNGTGYLSVGYPAEGPLSGAAIPGEANAGNAPVVAAVDPSPDSPTNPIIDPTVDPPIGAIPGEANAGAVDPSPDSPTNPIIDPIVDPPIGPPVDPTIDRPIDPPPPAVPEASTWVLMMLGFTGLGFVGYRRVKSGQTAPFAA
jgi:hypothetical protein